MAAAMMKLDDEFWDEPATWGLSDAAFRLYVSAASYCSRMSVEVVSASRLMRMLSSDRKSHAAVLELESARLIERGGVQHGAPYWRVCHVGIWWRTANRPRIRRAISEQIRLAVYSRDDYRCRMCGSPDELSLDHIHPHSLGGDDSMENLQTLCRSCNSRKGARV